MTTETAEPTSAAIAVVPVVSSEETVKKERKDKKRKHKDEGDAASGERKKSKKEKKEKKEKKDKKDKTDKKDKKEGTDEEKKARKEKKKQEKKERKQRKAERRAAAETGAEVETTTATATESSEPVTEDITPATTNGPSTPVPIATSSKGETSEFFKKNCVELLDPRAKDTVMDPVLSFDKLPAAARGELSPFASYKKGPTPIQAASWPYIFAGRDVIGCAETGSGKTYAFAVPAVEYVLGLPKKAVKGGGGGGAKVVIISPTRELALQIHEQIVRLAEASGLKGAVTCIYGGVPKDPQRAELSKASILVATPGRLVDFIEEGSAKLGSTGYLVLDEADRMLEKGFEDSVRKICDAMPPKDRRKNTLMFTATWPASVRQLAAEYMTDPVRVNVNIPLDDNADQLRANTKITQTVHVMSPMDKNSKLIEILRTQGKNDRVLVFALYKKEAARVELFLRAKGFRVGAIHGDLNQSNRTAALEEFKTGRTPILVATDVAARGLDIPAVKLVLNYTFPLTTEDFVHRVGRTGRAGETGNAITFFTDHDKVHSGGLINVLKAAGQEVPEALLKMGGTVKKKQHSVYGAFFKEDSGEKSKKIKFDD